MKRLILLPLTLFIAYSIFAQIPLKKGTAVFVELTTEANSNNKHEVMAVVGIDVNDTKTGETLITKGTPIVLHIERRKSRGIGIGLGLTYLPGFGFFFLMLKGEKIILPQGTMLDRDVTLEYYK